LHCWCKENGSQLGWICIMRCGSGKFQCNADAGMDYFSASDADEY